MPLLLRPLAAALLAALAATCAPAQSRAPQPDAVLSMEDAVRTALSGNPALRAEVHSADSARAGLSSAEALTNPDIVLTPHTDFGAEEDFLFRQPLEVNGVRSARAGIARARLAAAQAKATVSLRELVYSVKTSYIDLASSRDLDALSRELLAIAEESDRLTRRQVEAGTRPGIDQIQTGIEIVRARQEVSRAESRVAEASATLNTAMGRRPDSPIGPLAPLSSLALPPESAVPVESALLRRAEIAGAEADSTEALQEARLARAEGRPDLVPQVRVGTVLSGWGDAGVGLGITLPLLDYGSRRNRVRQAEIEAESGAWRVEAARNQVRQEVTRAAARLRAAEAVLKEYPQGVLEQAKRLLDASRTGFQAGQTGILAVLEAQRTHRAVQTEYSAALVDRGHAMAEMERATGAFPAELSPRESAGQVGGSTSR